VLQRKKPVAFSLAWILLFASGMRQASLGSTLAPTQLKGLTGVNVSVQVSREVPQEKELEGVLKKRVEDALVNSGLSTVAREEEWLEIRVSGKPIGGGTEATIAMFVSVRLREHVNLRRNHSLDVPGGGALTWWREGLWLSAPEEVRKTLEEAVLEYVELFADQVSSINHEVVTPKPTKQG
jgi:hypothetical protein